MLLHYKLTSRVFEFNDKTLQSVTEAGLSDA